MSAVAESRLTVAALLAKMSPGERDALRVTLAQQDMRDKSYLETPLGREVSRYLAAKRKELTDSSYVNYEGTLHKLVLAFSGCTLDDFENPRGADLVEQWMDRKWGGKEPGTYNVCHAHLKDFFRWQVRRGHMNSNPMELIARARKRQPLRETFSPGEVRAIIASASDLRDRIALRLLFHHGLRKGALQKIQFKYFDYARRELTVFTKGEKIQAIPLPEPAFWTDLERHVQDVQAADEHYLMCVVKPIPYGSPDGSGRRAMRLLRLPDQMMTSTPLHNWWGRRLEGAGVRYRHMHCARHTFAQMLLERTGDLRLAQQALGHVSIGTTQMYAGYDNEQLHARLSQVLGGDD